MAGENVIDLTKKLLNQVELLDKYWTSNGLPHPALDASGPQDLGLSKSQNAIQARENIIELTHQIQHLVMGPAQSLLNPNHLDMMVLQAIHRLRIAHMVPRDGSIIYGEIAKQCQVAESEIRRLLRHAMLNFIFAENDDGQVIHTASSICLATNKIVEGAVGIFADEVFPGAAFTVEALQQYPQATEPTQCGWALANNAKAPMFEELKQNHPDRAKKVLTAMDSFASMLSADPMIHYYDWASVSSMQFGGKVIDVGGGTGPVSISLAEKFPQLSFIVQDLPDIVKAGAEKVPSHLASRITFQEHDFFDPQLMEADVYFFRAVFHNWSDYYCVKMIRALIQALRKGSRVIVHDVCVPEHGSVSYSTLRRKSAGDLNMMILFNGKERSVEELVSLFEVADERFVVISAGNPVKNVAREVALGLTLVVIEWKA